MTGYLLPDDTIVSINEEDICYAFPGENDFKTLHMKDGRIIYALRAIIPPPPPVPEYFEKLVYIETNGDNTTENEFGQYIDIPYSANSNMIYYLTAQITAGPIGTSIAATAKTMFAKDFGKTRSGGGGASGAGTDNIYFLYDENGWSSPTKVANGGDNEAHTYIINYYDREDGKGYVQVDEKPLVRFSRAVSSFVDKDAPFSLGSWAEYGTEGSSGKINHMWCAKSKIYRLYIKNGATSASVINLVPVITIKEYTVTKEGITTTYPVGTVGMYDFAKDEFYVNTGKGTLGYLKTDGTYVAPTLPTT